MTVPNASALRAVSCCVLRDSPATSIRPTSTLANSRQAVATDSRSGVATSVGAPPLPQSPFEAAVAQEFLDGKVPAPPVHGGVSAPHVQRQLLLPVQLVVGVDGVRGVP